MKNSETRIHSITNSIGVYDIYKDIRKQKWLDIGSPVKEKDFYSIIRTVNKYLGQYLTIGKEIKLPYRMGILEVRKTPKNIRYANGKLIMNLPIDWKTTLQMWKEKPYTAQQKQLARFYTEDIYKIEYIKSKALFTNKTFISFRPIRELKQKLSFNIKQGILKDAYLRY